MKTSTPGNRPRTGFTLIEILVVIAIIAVLAAMGFAAASTALKRARMAADRAAATALLQAIEQFYDDYGRLPDLGAADGADTFTQSDSGLMNILQGLGPTGEAQNPRRLKYYGGRQATGDSPSTAYYGLFYSGRTSAQLFDAWRKKGSVKRHYQVLLDTNYDGELTHPFAAGQTFYDVPALVWSTGQDGLEARGDRSDPKNRDNVHSWD